MPDQNSNTIRKELSAEECAELLRDEVWVPVPGFEGIYEISSWGRARSYARIYGKGKPVVTPRILKPAMGTGTKRVRYEFSRDSKTYDSWRARFMLRAFVGEPPPNHEASHKDGDELNDRLDNLCWETHLENEQRKASHGTRRIGSQCSYAKLNEIQVRDFRARAKNGESPKSIWAEVKESISWSAFYDAITGRKWKHVPMP